MEKKDKEAKRMTEEEKQNLNILAVQDYDDEGIPLDIDRNLSVSPSAYKLKKQKSRAEE